MSEPIISLQPNPVPEPTGTERRAKARYALNVPAAFCHPIAEVGNDDCWTGARIQDVSASGIGLVLTHPVEPEVLLAIDLQGVSRLLLAHVAHATPRTEGGWLVGCALINPLSEEELQALL